MLHIYIFNQCKKGAIGEHNQQTRPQGPVRTPERRKIIDHRASQESVGLRPAVTNRVKQRLKRGLVINKAGLNLLTASSKMTCVVLKMGSDETGKKVEHIMKS